MLHYRSSSCFAAIYQHNAAAMGAALLLSVVPCLHVLLHVNSHFGNRSLLCSSQKSVVCHKELTIALLVAEVLIVPACINIISILECEHA